MARIVKIKVHETGRVRYWTQGHGGCTTVAVLAREPVWAGTGLGALGLVAGELVDPVAAQWLVQGRHPLTGLVLREPRMQTHPHAELGGAPFAAALRALASGRGLEPGQVLRSGRSRERWGRLERALAKAEAEKYTVLQKKPKKARKRLKTDTSVSYVDLRRLAKDAGLRLEDVYDPGALEFAWLNRDKQRPVGVGAFGLIVAWPKSFSVVAALAPPSVGRVISQAVAETMAEVVDAVETLAGYASRGRQGGGQLSRHVDGQGLAAVVLPHFLARRTEDGSPGDPHLHAHLTFPTLLQGADDAWGAFGSGGHELYRHIAVLGELAKARLRQRLAARLGMRFAFEPDTGEWEVVGVPLVLRRFWSSRREAIRAEAGPGASPAARRAAAAKLAERQRRQRRWEDVVLLERWHADATALVDDVPAMFASAVPGTPAPVTAPPTVDEVTARLQLPRAVAVRRKGAEFREVLAAVIKAYPDNLTSLEEALSMTDRVLEHAGFRLLSHRDGTGFRDTRRYRVPAALVGTSRNPVDWPTPGDAVTTPQTAPNTGKGDQAQQQFDLTLPTPARAPRRGPRPRPATPAESTDQVEMDFGLDQPAAGPADQGNWAGDPSPAEQPGITQQGGLPVERTHLMTLDQDLADQVVAARAEIAAVEAAAGAHDIETAALVVTAREGKGALWAALRKRRLVLEAVAVLARARGAMLEQAKADRDAAADLLRRAKRLREIAAEKLRNRFGRERKDLTDAQRQEAIGLAQDPGQERPEGERVRMGREDAVRNAKRLEERAEVHSKDALDTETKAAGLYLGAAKQAAAEGATVEGAVIEDGWPLEQKVIEEQKAVTADVASAEQARQEQQDLDRAAIGASRARLEKLGKEQDLRACMPARQRAAEQEMRAQVAEQTRAAAQAAREEAETKRAQARTQQQNQIQRNQGTGRAPR